MQLRQEETQKTEITLTEHLHQQVNRQEVILKTEIQTDLHLLLLFKDQNLQEAILKAEEILKTDQMHQDLKIHSVLNLLVQARSQEETASRKEKAVQILEEAGEEDNKYISIFT